VLLRFLLTAATKIKGNTKSDQIRRQGTTPKGNTSHEIIRYSLAHFKIARTVTIQVIVRIQISAASNQLNDGEL
jgi:hypothetical protein